MNENRSPNAVVENSVYIPTSTYRLQFNIDFPFKTAEKYANYFQRLGVSDIYSSPICKARKGSLHCYDVTDHSEVNTELGGEADFKALATALAERGMGLVVDVVPNHMGILDSANLQWWDMMENGPASPYANFFDIDWRAYKEELYDRVELPMLGQQFGICLESGELQIRFSDAGEFRVHYYETELPTDPRTWGRILSLVLDNLIQKLPLDDEQLIEFQSILTALGNLPSRLSDEASKVKERQREKEVCKRRLQTLISSNDLFRTAIADVLRRINGEPGSPQSFDFLEEFLEDQTYRLSFWRVAGDEINYRRFFDVNELAAIRVERPEVFQQVHSIIFRLIRDGCIRGLRIDHPDGLLNPPQYFTDLQQGCFYALHPEAPNQESGPPSSYEQTCALWVIVEKILGHNEHIRKDWAVHGTTGYEFLNLLNGVFVDQSNSTAFSRLYSRFTGRVVDFSELKNQCKKLILDISMSGELYTLARKLDRISEHNRRTRDFTLQTLQEALAEFIAVFPVYRSYIRPDASDVDKDDRFYIESAIRIAKKRNPSTDPTIFDFIGVILLMEEQELATKEQRDERKQFILALQQITGPVMAKGLEDTAFYRDFPLVSLNEVGGEPERFGVSVAEFHERCKEQANRWPASMTTTSTHDTKRSEDCRARINVLSEIPRQWERAIFRWRRLNSRRKIQIDGHHVPGTREEYLIYQTLLAIWPLRDEELSPEIQDRLCTYVVKAAREAKIHTSWINVHTAYEDALCKFTRELLDPARSSKFLQDFQMFARFTAIRGANNSLSQVLIKITAPGIPDFYQGCELWNTCLVDPDNRRPVDFDFRSRILEEVILRQNDPAYLSELLYTWRDGRIKMLVTHKGLAFRRSFQSLYLKGNHLPLMITGKASEQIIAYAQHHDQTWAITIAPRLLAKMNFPEDSLTDFSFWSDTVIQLPAGCPRRWHNIFTNVQMEVKEDGVLEPAAHLGVFPVALLVSQ